MLETNHLFLILGPSAVAALLVALVLLLALLAPVQPPIHVPHVQTVASASTPLQTAPFDLAELHALMNQDTKRLPKIDYAELERVRQEGRSEGHKEGFASGFVEGAIKAEAENGSVPRIAHILRPGSPARRS